VEDNVNGDFRVGPWLVEPSLNTLSRNGTSVHLEPKQIGVLVCLAQHQGEAVSKEKLLRTVWPDTFVGDDVLVRSIFVLRRSFEDDPKKPAFIQTIAKRGYRLVAPVAWINEDRIRTDYSGSRIAEFRNPLLVGRILRYGLSLVGGVLLLGLSFLPKDAIRTLLPLDKAPSIRSLAVLPMQNLSGDPNQEYLADAMTDELITELSGIRDLKVISRTSSMRYKKTAKSLPTIASEMNVDAIVEGSLLRSGDDLRVTLQLIYAPQDRSVWANRYQRKVADTFSLDRDVAQDIALQVQTQLIPPKNQVRQKQARPVSVKALDAYLQGKSHLDRVGQGSGDVEAREAAKFFQQAIESDPNFVQAYVGLIGAHEGRLLPSGEDRTIIKEAMQKVEELEPDSVEVAIWRAEEKASRWDWVGTEEEYRRAIELNPNSCDVHRSFARFLDHQGRLDEGWKEQQVAQQLDPNPELMAPGLDLPDALLRRGKYDEAIALLLRIDESHPQDGQTHLSLSQCYEQKGMYKEAIEELGRSATSYGYREIESKLRHAFAISGYRGALKKWAQEIEHLQVLREVYMPAYLGTVYARLGDTNRAFYWLEEAYKLRNGSGLGTDLIDFMKDPALQSVRTDPRYLDLLRRTGLPQ
jgi:TolB-like protein/DNA-binding winged helix-turn-helix (wHTH) protein/tetratricopeptide (TPR) repeat protein